MTRILRARSRDPALRCRATDAITEPGDSIGRIFDEPQQRQPVLMWAASRNFSPPNFTSGMFRRVSSISSGPLWLDVRNGTACFFRCVPDSRFSRTRSTMKMGTTRSPLRYEATADYALQPTNLQLPAILRYVSWAAVFSISRGPVTLRLRPFRLRERRDGPISDVSGL
jgi:hypothetical protein